jgi:hypothetical protein
LQVALNRIPNHTINNRRVPTGEAVALVRDLADVDWIGEQSIERTARQAAAA